MKKTKLILLSLLPLIASCGGGKVSSTSQDITSDSSEVNTSSARKEVDLSKVEELRETFANPITPPKANGIDETADPYVYRYNGKYYMYSTGAGSKIRCYQSDDLVNWEPSDDVGFGPGICVSGSASNYPTKDGAFPYAPEVIYYNGYFYLCTSVTGNGHYIFESEAPNGPFVCISKNLGHSIDGHFFIDENEDLYFYTAGGGNINAYKLEKDFMTFKQNDDGSEFATGILSASMGAWTEGPYVLQRDGAYYLTYTGTHYLSRDYRVDYGYAKPGSNPVGASSYTRMGTTLLSTTKTYYGLGHSCDVLGPDLDSYYIVYHNLTSSTRRFFNIARLAFNGSDMVANQAIEADCFVPAEPDFCAYDYTELQEVGNFLLSNSSSDDQFSVEFNTTGSDKMIFSYVDENNYCYLTFDGTNLKINEVKDGADTSLHTKTLNNEYDIEVNHTYRLGYKNGLLDIHFDSIELENDVEIQLNGGRIGFMKNNNFDDIGFLAYSNVAQGSSDALEYKEGVILANSYDEELSSLSSESGLEKISKGTFINEDSNNLKLAVVDDRATYRAFARYSGRYSINVRMPVKYVGKKIGLKINDKETKEIVIPGSNDVTYRKGDVNINLYNLDINEGAFNLSLVNLGDEVAFSQIEVVYNDEAEEDVTLLFNNDTDFYAFDLRGTLTPGAHGNDTSMDSFMSVTSIDTYHDYEISAKVSVHESENIGYWGFMLNAKNYSMQKDRADSTYQGGNYSTNYQGVLVGWHNDGTGDIANVDYSVQTPSYGGFDYTYQKDTEMVLKVSKKNNYYEIFVDDNMVHSFAANVSNLEGIVGFVSYKTALTISQLDIEIL